MKELIAASQTDCPTIIFSDKLFIPSQVYVLCQCQSSLNITENAIEGFNETAEEVNETVEVFNEKRVDEVIQQSSKTDNRNHSYQQYRERQRNIKSLKGIVKS